MNDGGIIFRIRITFSREVFRRGIDPLMLLEDLLSLGSVEEISMDRDAIPPLPEMDPTTCYAGWDLLLRTEHDEQDIRDVFMFVSGDGILEIEEVAQIEDRRGEQPGDRTPNDEVEMVQIESAQLNSIMGILGEIIMGQTIVSRIAEEIGSESGARLKIALAGLDRSTRDLQEQFMRIRMVPLTGFFEAMERLAVEAAAGEANVLVRTEGGETAVDRAVIPHLTAAAGLLLRNMVSHNRSTHGELRIGIGAVSQEGSVILHFSDDGAVDWTAEGGFTDDLRTVREEIDSFKGTLESGRNDEGSNYRIRIPLALAIIEGMLVRVGRDRYIFPLLSIVESLRPRREDVKTVEGRGEVVHVRGEFVTLVRLHRVFDVATDVVEPWEALVMILEAGSGKIGVMIDDLIGQQQIVVKSLQGDLSKSRALSGAAVMGDGEVALIVDVAGLFREIAA